MGFFSFIGKTVGGLLSSKSKRKAEEAKARAEQAKADAERFRFERSRQEGVNSVSSKQQNKMWMPFAIGGGGLLLVLIIFLTKK